MSFQFIDSTAPDAANRKKIRTHVMKGKNVGKARIRKPRPATTRVTSVFQAVDEEFSSRGQMNSVTDESREIEGDMATVFGTRRVKAFTKSSYSLERPVAHEMGAWPFASSINLEKQETVFNFLQILNYALYPSSMCVKPEISQIIWFKYLFMDEAFLYSALALSEIFHAAFAGRKEDSALTLRHLSKSFNLLSSNIAVHGTSDLIIATVLYISLGERMKGHFERGQIHVKVLKKMVEFKGGIKNVLANTSLAQKIFLADIETAIHDGTPTHFELADVPGEDVLRNLHVITLTRQDIDVHSRVLDKLDSGTREIYNDLVVLAAYAKSSSPIPRISYAHFSDILARINYKVLALRSFTSVKSSNTFDTFCQLSMHTFMISFWHTPCIQHELFYRLKGHFTASITHELQNEEVDNNMILWSLFIASCSIFRELDGPWFRSTTLGLVISLGVNSWVALHTLLNRFPWISFFHEKMARKLWAAINTWGKSRK